MKKFLVCILFLGFIITFSATNSWTKQEDPIEKLKKAAKADPGDYAPHFGLGQAYHKIGIYKNAIEEIPKSYRIGASLRSRL